MSVWVTLCDNDILLVGNKPSAYLSCIIVYLEYRAVSVDRELKILLNLVVSIVLGTCLYLVDIVILFLIRDIVEDVFVATCHLIESTAEIKIVSAVCTVHLDLYALLVDIGILKDDTWSYFRAVVGPYYLSYPDRRLFTVNAEASRVCFHWVASFILSGYSYYILAIPAEIYRSRTFTSGGLPGGECREVIGAAIICSTNLYELWVEVLIGYSEYSLYSLIIVMFICNTAVKGFF